MANATFIADGQVFTRWTVIREAPSHRQPCGKPCRMFFCRCDCGNEATVSLTSLISQRSKSCGCLMKEVNGVRIGAQSKTHGNTPTGYNEYKSLFFVWNTIRQRCHNKNSTKYHVYGAKGIKICDEWNSSFQNFRDWSITNGYYKQPKETPYKEKLSIDRIDVNGDYTPENCRWITISENSSRRYVK